MSYKMLGDYIQLVNNRNKSIITEDLRGLSMSKEFRKSTSNIVGVDLSKYKLVYKNQFACDFMSVIRVHKLPVVLHSEEEPVIVSPAYTVFEVTDENVLLPEYLMMWFRRPEFDRYADFRCDSAIRGGFKWDELCEVTLPIPSIEQQQQIVDEYNTVTNRIQLNEQINQNLEATAQALYKHWFVDFEFPIDLCQSELVEDPNCHLEHVTSSTSPRAQSRGEKREVSLETLNKIDFTKGYKSSGGKMVYNKELDKEIPEGWSVERIGTLCQISSSKRVFQKDYVEDGVPFYRSKEIILKKEGEVISEPLFISNSHYSDLKDKYGIPKKGDILLTAVGTLGVSYRVSDETFYFKDGNLMWFKDFLSDRLSIFLYDFMQSEEFEILIKDITIGSTQKAITISTMSERNIIKPLDSILDCYAKISNSIRLNQKVNNQGGKALKYFQSLLLAKMTQGVTNVVEV